MVPDCMKAWIGSQRIWQTARERMGWVGGGSWRRSLSHSVTSVGGWGWWTLVSHFSHSLGRNNNNNRHTSCLIPFPPRFLIKYTILSTYLHTKYHIAILPLVDAFLVAIYSPRKQTPSILLNSKSTLLVLYTPYKQFTIHTRT